MAMQFTSTTTAGRPDARHEDAWDLRVERGPEWLFVRLEPASRGTAAVPDGELADGIWATLQEHRARRLVLELDGVRSLDDRLAGLIAELGGRLREDGGMLRICGLSGPHAARLKGRDGADDVAVFASRHEAIGARARGVEFAPDRRAAS